MRLRINDPLLTDQLVRFLRSQDCLAVKRGPRDVEVIPIDAVSKRSDRAQVQRYVDLWLGANPGATIELFVESA